MLVVFMTMRMLNTSGIIKSLWGHYKQGVPGSCVKASGGAKPTERIIIRISVHKYIPVIRETQCDCRNPVITTQSKRPRSLLPTSPSFLEEMRGAGDASHAPTLGGSVGLRGCKGSECATLSEPPRSFLPSPQSPREIRGAGDASHTPTLGGRDMHVKGIYL